MTPSPTTTATRVPATSGPEAFSAYLERHASAVLGYLRSIVGPSDADDVFQEAFLAALRAWDGHRGEVGRAWVFRIAHNKAIDHHRAAARRPISLAEPPEPAVEDADPLEAEEIRAGVAALPDGQRGAVSLRYFAELSYREIGEALGCSEAAARRRAADGVAALRAAIDDETTKEER